MLNTYTGYLFSLYLTPFQLLNGDDELDSPLPAAFNRVLQVVKILHYKASYRLW